MITSAAAIAGYLIGSVSFARLVGWMKAPGEELSGAEFAVGGTEERWVYHGVSATTAGKRFGARWGLAVAVLDGLKALIPILVARQISDDLAVVLALSLGVIVGHVWPVFHRFHGGRGQSPIVASLVGVDPVAIPVIVLTAMLIGLTVFTSVYMARNGYPLLVGAWFVLSDGWGPTAVYGLAVSVVYLLAIQPDLGEERRTRLASGRSSAGWPARTRHAWRDMFDPSTE